jgi:hypothetical protein
LSGPQCGQRDEQLGQVSQGRVEKTADQVASLVSHRLGGEAEQSRQWDDGRNGQQEKQRVRFGLEELPEEDNRHEHQEPQQRHVTYLFKQRSHLAASPDLRVNIPRQSRGP